MDGLARHDPGDLAPAPADELRCALPLNLQWDSIWYRPVVQPPGGKKYPKVVLRGCSSYAAAGTLTGVMGPSGCGKTSLLTVVAGMAAAEHVQGTVLVNGQRQALPKRLVGFVFQEDLMLANLTVAETLMVVARLRLPQRAEGVRQNTVDALLSELGIAHCADSIVGGMRVRGISGGERKRLAVGIELVTSPSLLMLDEPTSGLDSSTALSLVQTIHSLALKGHTILCTIHQPRTTIFDLFDHLLVMEAGCVVYDGSVQGCVAYFEHAGFALPSRTNPADWLMDLLKADMKRPHGPALPLLYQHALRLRDPTHVLAGELDELNPLREEGGKGDGECHMPVPTLEPLGEPGKKTAPSSISPKAEIEDLGKYATSFWVQFVVLLERAFKQQSRTALTSVNLVQTSTYAFMTSAFWWQMEESESSMTDRASLLFFIIIAQSNAVVISTVNVFVSERSLLLRERSKGMYHVGAYMLAKTIADMVNTVLLPTVVFANSVYWATGLKRQLDAYVIFIVTFLLVIMVAQSMGLLFSIAIKNVNVALTIAPVIVLMLMILGGFYIPFDNIPFFVRWLNHFSFAKYGFVAFCLNEFGGREFECDAATSCETKECPVRGFQYLEDVRDMGGQRIWVCLVVLVAMQVVLRLAAHLTLRFSY